MDFRGFWLVEAVAQPLSADGGLKSGSAGCFWTTLSSTRGFPQVDPGERVLSRVF